MERLCNTFVGLGLDGKLAGGRGVPFLLSVSQKVYLAARLSVLAGGSTVVMTGFQTIAKGLSLSQEITVKQSQARSEGNL